MLLHGLALSPDSGNNGVRSTIEVQAARHCLVFQVVINHAEAMSSGILKGIRRRGGGGGGFKSGKDSGYLAAMTQF